MEPPNYGSLGPNAWPRASAPHRKHAGGLVEGEHEGSDASDGASQSFKTCPSGLTLLAGIGMEETGHGRKTTPARPGLKDLMQFMLVTWASMGVDGDRHGRADIHNDADSIHSAAHYLTKSGVSAGVAGVRRALFAYNHVDWYVNDVLY